MKKLLFLMSVSILFFTSCIPNPTEDPDPYVPPTTALLRKKVETYTRPAGDSIVTFNFTYNSSKLVSIIDDTADSDLYATYTEDLITKLEYKFANGTVDQTETFDYDDTHRLSTYVRIEPATNIGDKETYVYNANGTISVTHFIGNATTQTQLNNTSVITFTNGEVSNVTQSDGSIYSYTYDTKNNPYKNITGYSKIAFAGGVADGIAHNVVSESDTFAGSTTTYATVFTYNSSDYPTTSLQDEDAVPASTYLTTYFY